MDLALRGRRAWRLAIPLAGGLALAALGCRSAAEEVVVYTSVDQVFSEPVFREFERQSGLAVRAVFDTEETKSTGVLNRILAESGHPRADVFWSGDPVRSFVLVVRGLVEPYVSPNASAIPAAFRAADGTWTGLAARARVFLVNRTKVGQGPAPRSLQDLLDPRWRGQAAIANPLFGTTTMHVAALFATWGDERARAFMSGLRSNQVRIASSNGEVKRLVVAGEVAFGLADTDDAHEALQAGAAIDVVYPDQDGMGTLVMPTTVLLLRAGPHPEPARRLIDFLLTPGVEKRLADSAAHMPLQPGVVAPPEVRRVSEVRAMQVDYARVASEMERIQPWLREWAGQ